jgi:hypothetical protein
MWLGFPLGKPVLAATLAPSKGGAFFLATEYQVGRVLGFRSRASFWAGPDAPKIRIRGALTPECATRASPRTKAPPKRGQG